MLPHSLVEPLQIQLASARALHESDLREGFGRVYLPFALARKARFSYLAEREELLRILRLLAASGYEKTRLRSGLVS